MQKNENGMNNVKNQGKQAGKV